MTNPFDTAVEQVSQTQATSSGFSRASFLDTAGFYINALFSVAGVIALFVIAYAGLRWFSAGGESEKTQEASAMIRYAALGLVIMLVAYALTNFIFNQIVQNIGGIL